MPIYEYDCKTCDERFEIVAHVRHAGSKKGARCPKCGGKETERCVSRIAVETGRKSYHPAAPTEGV